MTEKGWIKIHRKVLESEVFKDGNLYRVWTVILMTAARKPETVVVNRETVFLRTGQTVASARYVATMLGASKTTVCKCLNRLEELEMIRRTNIGNCTVISVVNWGRYQGQGVPQNEQGVPQNEQGVPQNEQGVPQNEQGVPIIGTNTRQKTIKKEKTTDRAVETLNSLSNPYEGLNRAQTEDAEHYAYRLEKLGGCDSRLPEIVAEWVIRYDSSDISEAVTSAERGRARNPVAYVRKILSEKESRADRERREREACTKGGGTWL